MTVSQPVFALPVNRHVKLTRILAQKLKLFKATPLFLHTFELIG